ncbi:MAG: fatty acid desaturase [Candidatus Polarisedimenticolia bacterium]
MRQALAARQKPVLRSSVWQILNTFVPYVVLWGLMIWSLDVSYALTLALAVVAAGFLVRTFIIFHDCTHGSFLKSPRANHILGFIAGVMVFTPYAQWRHGHALHHATSGDLDRRGVGDIWTLTVQEYQQASRLKRLKYRLFRSPFVLFIVAPLIVFLIEYRFTEPASGRRERRGVHLTNLALLALILLMSWLIGFKAWLLIQVPVMLIAGTAGVWLFYMQHQFDGAYWERGDDWDFEEASVRGSSYYKLPRVLQWFSGNIGFHHVHHLSPAIPNYSLPKCHADVAAVREVTTVTLWSSLTSLSLRLWDERQKKMVGFRAARQSS